MQTLLILGAGPMQVPAFETAKAMGLRVVGIDPSADAPGLCLADAFLNTDLRDFDACVCLARRQKIDGVMTLAADFPVPAVAEICHRLGLTGLDRGSALVSTNKIEMLKTLSKAGIPVPRSLAVASVDAAFAATKELEGDVIFKPADSSGGRGITSLREPISHEQVRAAYLKSVSHGDTKTAIVSQLVDGPEFSVEAITYQGQTTIVAATDKLSTGPPYHVEVGHSQPARSRSSELTLLRELAIAGIEALEIDSSPSHVEIRMGPKGPHVIEIGARLAGGYIASDLVPLSSGIDIVRSAVQLALGERPTIRPVDSNAGGGAAIRFLTPTPGRVRAIRGLAQALRAEGVRRLAVDVTVGDHVQPLIDATQRTGFVICDGADAETAIRNVRRARDLVCIETEEV